MDKKHQKYPKNVFFPHLRPPIFFFKNRVLSILYPYGALTFFKNDFKVMIFLSNQVKPLRLRKMHYLDISVFIYSTKNIFKGGNWGKISVFSGWNFANVIFKPKFLRWIYSNMIFSCLVISLTTRSSTKNSSRSFLISFMEYYWCIELLSRR